MEERLIAARVGCIESRRPGARERGGIQAAFDKRQGRVPLGYAQLRIGYRPINERAHARLALERSTASPSLSLSLFIPRPAAQGRLIPARLQKIDFTNANRHHRQCEAKVNGARCTPEFRCVAVSLHKTEREKNLYRTAKLCPLFTGFRNFL